MNRYVTIDGGTTNTRVSLVFGGEILDTVKIKSECDLSAYKAALKERITEILDRNSLSETDVTRILATGTMATSEIGLCPLSHLITPVNIEGLKQASYETEIPEISGIPFVFVRGVKTPPDTLGSADMMRGEESEIMGLIADNNEPGVYMLMGSHTKMVRTDGEGSIVDIRTMLTGELIEAVSSNTILKHTVRLDAGTADREYLKMGCDLCRERSVNEALFKVRILKNIFGENDLKVYSFFLGAILWAEVKYLINSGTKRVLIGGNGHLKDALSSLVSECTDIDVIILSDAAVEGSVSLGLVKIFEYRSKQNETGNR